MRFFLSFLLIVLTWFPSTNALAQSTNCSLYPTSPSCASLDNDGDGQANGVDPYPNDSTNNDADGDGLPNNSDPFPNDPNNGSTPSPSPSTSPSPGSSPSPSPSSSPNAPVPSNNGGNSGSGVFGWISSIWNSLLSFLNSFWKALSTIFSIVLGAIANPAGAVNTFICKVIDIVAAVWPSTPDSMKISNILVSFSTAFPIIGYGIVVEITQTIGTIFLLFAAIKIYKLIPFKMS